MITNEESPDPRRRLGKNLQNPSEQELNSYPSEDEKGASNADIKNRDTETRQQSEEDLAPSGDMITNTGADIGQKQPDADAATG